MISIQEAAEKYVQERGYNLIKGLSSAVCTDYTTNVTHYLDLLKAEGYEMVKVEGSDDEIAQELIKSHDAGFTLEVILQQALAIGRQQGKEDINDETKEFIKQTIEMVAKNKKLEKELKLKDALIKIIEEQSASRLARINELTP